MLEIYNVKMFCKWDEIELEEDQELVEPQQTITDCCGSRYLPELKEFHKVNWGVTVRASAEQIEDQDTDDFKIVNVPTKNGNLHLKLRKAGAKVEADPGVGNCELDVEDFDDSWQDEYHNRG